MSEKHLLNQFTTRQIDLDWDEQNQLKASTSTKPDGRGGQEIIQTQYCYDAFGRRIAKQSQTYQKQIITQKVKAKTEYQEPRIPSVNSSISNQLGSSTSLSLGGGGFATDNRDTSTRPIVQRAVKTIQTETTQLVQKQAVWNVWDGNRILQDYNGKHVFTTVYEAAICTLNTLVLVDDQLNKTRPKI